MPSKSVRRRRRSRQGCLPLMIGALTIVALGLIGGIVLTELNRDRTPTTGTSAPVSGGNYVDVSSITAEDHQLVLNINSFDTTPTPLPGAATPTPTVTASPEPTATPEPTLDPNDPYAAVRPQPLDAASLPIFRKANTEAKQIAITVDECNGASITTQFAQAAAQYGAQLTLFPTGENIMRQGMTDVLRACVNDLGFEIENRCYSGAARLYRMSAHEMAEEIWKQNMALCYVLGMDYQPHFLRLYGGNGENDRRTHAYLKQLGYLGVAHWTVNGSIVSYENLELSVSPGNIYCFKATEDDLARMKYLMREAKTQGYQMVTLNALFGYEENARTPKEAAEILNQVLPELEDYDGAYYLMKQGDCTWATLLLQQRLTELGYLPEGSADGNFGAGTAAALSAFQAKSGLAASGAADIRTQEYLYSENAPSSRD